MNFQHKRAMGLVCAGWLGLAIAGVLPAWAHEGHDHGATAPLPALPLAPRFAVASDIFEVVGVVDASGLTVYVDRFADNTPVAGARVEIDSKTVKGIAREISPATYRLAGPLAPGAHALMLTIEAGADADLLSASLLMPAANAQAAAVAPPAPRGSPVLWQGGLAGLGVAGVAMLGLLRRREVST